MGSDDGKTSHELPEKHTHHHSDGTTVDMNSSNLKDDDTYVEITVELDIDLDMVVHTVKTVPFRQDRSSFGSSSSSVAQNAKALFKQVSQELKRLTSLTKRPTYSGFDRTKSATYAFEGLRFISKTDGDGWDPVAKKFDELTKETNGLLPRTFFGECIGMKKDSKDFALELLNAITTRYLCVSISGDFITKIELKNIWDQMVQLEQDFVSRLQFFLTMVDKDADGRITKAEIIKMSASANKLSNIDHKADEYTTLIMEELDPDDFGYIMIESLKTLLLESLPQAVKRGEGQYLSQQLKTRNPWRRRYQDFKYFLHDNWRRVWILVLWIAVMAGLFTWRYLQYKNKEDVYEVMGHCVCMAKGAAETLKLNMALILLPVCRNTITWLRNKTKLGKAVPFDDNLNFHSVVATGIGLGVGIHGIYHLACDFPRLLHASEEKYEPMEKYFGKQPSNYWWFVKGWEGVTGIIMVVLMAIAFTLASPSLRRTTKPNIPKPLNAFWNSIHNFLKKLTWFYGFWNSIHNFLKKLTGFDAFWHSIHLFLDALWHFINLFLKKVTGFNAFWYSHHLFVVVYACLIIHGLKLYLTKDWYKKTTWMYLAVPVILYGSERLIRAFRSSFEPVEVQDVAFYPEGVTALHMSKPEGFKYRSGQYMFVNCAAVSPFEWHPFSFTSSPGDDYLSVHIRTFGDWTERLRTVISKVCKPPPDGKSGLHRADGMQGPNPNYPRVLIDGPYGAPAQEYKKYDVVLLVGLGIGATPMISIVKDVANNMKAKEEEENALENGLFSSPLATNNSPSTANDEFKTKKAYFYWVTREEGSFEWFKGVMNEVADLDDKGVIEMHNYCSSIYEEGDPRSIFITMLQSINHTKNGVDVVAGTRVKSHFAKPNWRNVYQSIADNHRRTTVGVFYCGIPTASKELKRLASEFSQMSHTSTTKFDFHMESF